jgi:hypothetical protein
MAVPSPPEVTGVPTSAANAVTSESDSLDVPAAAANAVPSPPEVTGVPVEEANEASPSPPEVTGVPVLSLSSSDLIGFSPIGLTFPFPFDRSLFTKPGRSQTAITRRQFFAYAQHPGLIFTVARRQPPSPPEVTGVPSNPFLARKLIFRLFIFFDPALAFAFPFPFDPLLEDFDPPLRAFFFVATVFPPYVETAESGASLFKTSVPVKSFRHDGRTPRARCREPLGWQRQPRSIPYQVNSKCQRLSCQEVWVARCCAKP